MILTTRTEQNYLPEVIPCIKIINRINLLLKNAIELFDQRLYIKAKEKCLKCQCLLDIVSTNKFSYINEINAAKLVLKSILSRLSQFEDTNSLHNNDGKLISMGRAGNFSDNKLSNTFDISSFIYSNIQVTFDDVIGCEKAKISLEENVILQLTLPEETRDAIFRGIRSGVGNVLLHGPPGTGKTLLAQAAAKEANATFICIRPSDILSKYQGESEKFLNNIFETAKSFKKTVIFLDELDSIATSRNSNDDCIQSRRLLSELLLQLNEIKASNSLYKRKREENSITRKKKMIKMTTNNENDKNKNDNENESDSESNSDFSTNRMAIIGATNRIEDIDEAMMRRFECKVHVGVPNKMARIKLFQKLLEDVSHSLTDKDYDNISNLTYGWSGSDIETLTREAAMIPLRDFRRLGQFKDNISSSMIRPVVFSDFENALRAVVLRTGEVEVVEEEE